MNKSELIKREKFLLPINHGGDIKVGLAYPNRYWVAMSNLGFQTIYKLLSDAPRFAVERAFIPENEGERVTTFEKNRYLSELNILAISCSFETDYPYVIDLIKDAGVDVKLLAKNSISEQGLRYRPFIFGGGAGLTLNPEPLANFFDAIAIGEGEEIITEFSSTYVKWKEESSELDDLLRALTKIEGIYVPKFYKPKYYFDVTVPGGILEGYEVTEKDIPSRPLRRIVKDLDKTPTFTVIQTPETEFKSMFMTETSRGCEVGCKFCVAGYMYRPVRKRSEETLNATLKIGIENSESIGFVGAAVSSHPKIAEMVSRVAEAGKRASLSSIMSQRVTDKLSSSLSESEYKTVALAPEAGSENLRFRIGKRVLNKQIANGVETLAKNGIKNFKFYFIVGLPSETESDVRAIPELILQMREASLRGMREQEGNKVMPRLVLSVNPFIPKAWTPFQRHEFLGSSLIKKRLEIVRSATKKIPNVEFKAEAPKESYFQTLMSRGDRRVGAMLLRMKELGHDWQWLTKDHHDLESVPQPSYYVERRLSAEEFLPWEVVDLKIKRSLLEREYIRTFEDDVTGLIQRANEDFGIGVSLEQGILKQLEEPRPAC